MEALEDAFRVLGLDSDATLGEVYTRYHQIMASGNVRPDGRPRTNLPAVRHSFNIIMQHMQIADLLIADDDDEDDNDEDTFSDSFFSPADYYDTDQLRESKFSRRRTSPDTGYRTNTDGAAVAACATSLVQEEENAKHENRKTNVKKKKKKKKKKKPDSSIAVNVNNNSSDARNENTPASDSDGEGLDLDSAFAKAARKASAEKLAAANGSKTEPKRAAGRATPAQGAAAAAAAAPAPPPPDTVRERAHKLGASGTELAKRGQYPQAVQAFTQAVRLDPDDHRFFGNRSFCLERLQQYDKALKDAEQAIQIDPSWPKGYFRKGRAYLGQKKYQEAEEAFRHVLKLDQDVPECRQELKRLSVYKLMTMGFEKNRARSAIEQYGTEEAAVNALLRGDVRDDLDISPEWDSDDTGEPTPGRSVDPKEDPSNVEGLTSLWVGNIMQSVTDRDLAALFARHGAVTSVRVLPDRFCAFINFGDKKGASLAMQHLQGHEFHGNRLKIKFPDNPIVNGQQKIVLGKKGVGAAAGGPRKLSGPVGDGECFYWRTAECTYGTACKYKHIPASKGIDRKQWRR
ncbi:uncharacterized protein LOC119112202 [Pollicipes pollicipes]|uniref:uncharacterized protein LOC119112202 n=1 Tax=Pollicipes pollicipes TaxID=41117 RepID=UPI0018859D74|nr:uncharacterized protein LOC119112202 [Pollicipes pollicipes]XP_037092184.1 uncharacterized protein LOC119112202 [Pollicipes pollicipes]XP_037092185.1 uncharacterized protein LOC119112202 [Pollicipes pollicipes]XP_037092186.1 uncharacterized protein LOC119112202 [Pollicipes pollicipes]XP_037092187.1 uncharacterized protein LOC119112202 [Pollicipes pollicipes]